MRKNSNKEVGMPKPNEGPVGDALVEKHSEEPKSNVQLRKGGGIKVKAKRKGFFRRMRKKADDVFTVPSMKDLGDWMECLDPDMEAERQKMLKERKQKRRAGN